MSIQNEIIRELHVKPQINAKDEIRARIDFLKAYLVKVNAKGYVLGISGGQDSTLAGKLAQMAIEELRSEGYEAIFIAVRLPYKTQKDESDAQLALEFIQPDREVTFDIADTVDTFEKSYLHSVDQELKDYHKGNVKARVRMITQYAIGGMEGLLVIGTDHAAEAVTGFYTKFGDGGADILPLSGLNKRQGKSLLKELNAVERLYTKEPTADLLDETPLQSDEAELGISYDVLDDYLEGKEITKADAEKIENQYVMTKHKRTQPVSMYDGWWK
ncbi:ammonia-dependent NAD(+) synthetase [Oceanobacillus saliphilus]|uniref:ammonia-dependent NAD(+) synthetase n=1 Tax=Oceanobacillus saliphilus TaxID=2925834 RepID=UPI00201DA21D|nr:ammonia-dependent NAD(+) synthetase [Oceanobacillus saliphilus]